MPDAKTATPAALAVPVASAADSSKRPKPDDDAPDLSVQKRVWVSIDGKPRAHYVRYLTSHFDEILDKARQQLESTGASATNGGEQQKPPLVTLELQGKGASTEPPVPGMPEQPLHVLIRGSSVSAPLAAILVEQALLDAQEAEVSQEDWDSEPPEAAITGDRGAEASNPNNAGAIATLDSYRRSSTYRPASVAQLIGAHGPGSANLPVIGDDQDAVEEEMRVPHSVVGLIIGRGGEAIAALQMRTRCKVQIQKEAELTPGQTLRVIHLRAATQDALDAAKAHIERLVQERAGSGAGGGGGMGSGASKVSSPANAQTAPSNPKDAAAAKVAEAVTAGHAHLQVEVPEADVGLVIGRQGATIRSIQDATGANIQVPPSVPGQSVRLVDITHPMLQGAEAAQRHIQDLLTSRPRTAGVSSGSAAGGAGSGGGHVTIQVPVRFLLFSTLGARHCHRAHGFSFLKL
jgi:far upstream element-binding protein